MVSQQYTPLQIWMLLIVLLTICAAINAQSQKAQLSINHNSFTLTFPPNTFDVELTLDKWNLPQAHKVGPVLVMDCELRASTGSSKLISERIITGTGTVKKELTKYDLTEYYKMPSAGAVNSITCTMYTYDKAIWDLHTTFRLGTKPGRTSSFRNIHPTTNLYPHPIQAVLNTGSDPSTSLFVKMPNLFWLTDEIVFGFRLVLPDDTEIPIPRFRFPASTNDATTLGIYQYNPPTGGASQNFYILDLPQLGSAPTLFEVELVFESPQPTHDGNFPTLSMFYIPTFSFDGGLVPLTVQEFPPPVPENIYQVTTLSPVDLDNPDYIEVGNISSLERFGLPLTQYQFNINYIVRSHHANEIGAELKVVFSPAGFGNFPFPTKFSKCSDNSDVVELPCQLIESEIICSLQSDWFPLDGTISLYCVFMPTINFSQYPRNGSPVPPIPLQPMMSTSLGVPPLKPGVSLQVSSVWQDVQQALYNELIATVTLMHYGSHADARQNAGVLNHVKIALPATSQDLIVTIKLDRNKFPLSSDQIAAISAPTEQGEFTQDLLQFTWRDFHTVVINSEPTFCAKVGASESEIVFSCPQFALSSNIEFLLYLPLSNGLEFTSTGDVGRDIAASAPWWDMGIEFAMKQLVQYDDFSSIANAHSLQQQYTYTHDIRGSINPVFTLPLFCMLSNYDGLVDNTVQKVPLYTPIGQLVSGYPRFEVPVEFKLPAPPLKSNPNSVFSPLPQRDLLVNTVFSFNVDSNYVLFGSDPVLVSCTEVSEETLFDSRQRSFRKTANGSSVGIPHNCIRLVLSGSKLSVGYVAVPIVYRQIAPGVRGYDIEMFDKEHRQDMLLYVSTIGTVMFQLRAVGSDESEIITPLREKSDPQTTTPTVSAISTTFRLSFLTQFLNLPADTLAPTKLVFRLFAVIRSHPTLINSLRFTSSGLSTQAAIPANFFHTTASSLKYYIEIHEDRASFTTTFPPTPQSPTLLWTSEQFLVAPKCQIPTLAEKFQSACQNDGVCLPNGSCLCNPPWAGTKCELKNDPPCEECNIAGGAVCSSSTNYQCVCPSDNSFTGPTCSTPQRCNENVVCKNSGSFPPITDYTDCPTTCICPDSWSPPTCQRCGLTCTNGGQSSSKCLKCLCPSGFTGAECKCVGAKVVVTLFAYNPDIVDYLTTDGVDVNVVPDLTDPDITAVEFGYAIVHQAILDQLTESKRMTFQSMKIAIGDNPNANTSATAVPYKTTFTIQVSYSCPESNPAITSTAPLLTLPQHIFELDIVQTTFIWDLTVTPVVEVPEITPTDSTLESHENGSNLTTFTLFSMFLAFLLSLIQLTN